MKKKRAHPQEDNYQFLLAKKSDKKPKKSPENKDLESIITKTVEKLLKEQQDKDKHINPSPRQNSVSSPNDSDGFSDTIQFAQDPNDYDSGMSFDSIALHNLDT